MIIETVKELEDTFLVNGYLAVPKNPDNTDFKRIQEWIANGGIVESDIE